jgi:uncharacterized HAD superfamily protein
MNALGDGLRFPFFNSSMTSTQNHYSKPHIVYDFITLKEQIESTYRLVNMLPRDVDCVVGIPRAGLITATIVATRLGKKLTTPELFMQGRTLKDEPIVLEKNKVLLIDDGAGRGVTMKKAKDKLQNFNPRLDIVCGVSHVYPKAASIVTAGTNLIREVWLESELNENPDSGVGSDLDGVLCFDFAEGTLPSVEAYQNLEAKFIPLYVLDFIATGRHERFRKVTEEWLAKQGIKYKQLIMRTEAEGNDNIMVKIKAIESIRPRVYFESHTVEAERIYKETLCPVLCFQTMTLYRLEKPETKTDLTKL